MKFSFTFASYSKEKDLNVVFLVSAILAKLVSLRISIIRGKSPKESLSLPWTNYPLVVANSSSSSVLVLGSIHLS